MEIRRCCNLLSFSSKQTCVLISNKAGIHGLSRHKIELWNAVFAKADFFHSSKFRKALRGSLLKPSVAGSKSVYSMTSPYGAISGGEGCHHWTRGASMMSMASCHRPPYLDAATAARGDRLTQKSSVSYEEAAPSP